MENTQTAVAGPSPAPQQTFEIPSDPQANLEWRTTGKLPDAKTPKAASTPAKPASPDNTGETAPASATGTKQETAKEAKEHPTAEDRVKELLADLKRAGLSPIELKTFRREAQAAAADPAKPSETTVPPQGLAAPKKPDTSNMTWEEAEAAKEKYFEDFADYKAKLAVQEDRQARAEEARSRDLAAKVASAKARYGDQTETTIGEATRAVLDEKTGVPLLLQHFMSESKVLVDVMYVLGSKDGETAAFIELARSDPGAAIRKFTLMEQLVEQELAGGTAATSGTAAAGSGNGSVPERGADGKFVSQNLSQDPPAKKKPAAPPPAEELSTRGSAPADPIEAAVRNNDFAAFKAEEDRRDLARRRGA